MAKTRRTVGEEDIRKLSRMGGGASLGLTLPIGFLRLLGWKEKQKVTVKKQGSKLIVKD